MALTASPLLPHRLAEAFSYLAQYEEKAQFLINNLAIHGPKLTAHPNSGNFKCIEDDGKIRGIFCLTKRGNLLAQTDGAYAILVLEACQTESQPLHGFVGEEASMLPIWEEFHQRNPQFATTFASKEILYRFHLSKPLSPEIADERVRLLTEADYPSWLELHLAYMKEFGLPEQISAIDRKAEYARQCQSRLHWGLFLEGQLAAKAMLNSSGQKVGQVGGVFTKPKLRRRGLAHALMKRLLEDCRTLHAHKKNILYTGVTDLPAQKLYEGLGYEQIGFYTIIFGS